MRRMVSALLALVLTASMTIPLGGCGTPKTVGPRPPAPPAFTTEYETDATNVDFFINNDEFETLLTANPLYPGAQELPTPGLHQFEAARRKKVDEVIAAAATLNAASLNAKPGLIALRSAYIDFLDAVYKLDRKKLEKFKQGSLENLTALAFKEYVCEQQYSVYAESTPTSQPNADSFEKYLQVTKATELGGLQLREGNDIAAYSAMAVIAFKDHPNAAVRKLAEEYDAKMSALDSLMTQLDPVAAGIETVNGGLMQLASADYYMGREASNWMAAELPKVTAAVAGMQPKEGVSAEDIAFYQSSVAAWGDFHKATAERLAAVDTSGLVSVRDVPKPGLGILGVANAAETVYTPNKDADAANKVLSAPAPAKTGYLSTAWSGVKNVFGKAQTVAGVTVDTLGAGVYNISSVGCGWWYGSPIKDTLDDIARNSRDVINDYHAGQSGSKTLRTAGAYLDDAEKGVSWAASTSANAIVNKPYQWLGGTGETRVGKGAAWVTGGLAKITAGMFTGFAKGIYKVADTGSNAKDVAGGVVDIGLSFIGGSKVLIKGSTALKGAAESAPTLSQLGKGFLATWKAATTPQSLTSGLGQLVKNKGLTGEAAWTLISNAIALDVRNGIRSVLVTNRAALITSVKNAASRTLGSDVGNWQETVRSSLQELFVKSFTKTREGWLDALGTTLGGSAAGYFDNLVSSQLDPLISALVAEALAGAPEPEQMSGKWSGSIIVTQVPETKAEKTQASEGCDFDINWDDLKGRETPVNWTIKMGPSGKGSVKARGGSGTGSGTITYADGNVTIVLRKDKSAVTLTGAAKFAESGGITMGGSWSSPIAAGLSIGGTWSASK